MTYTTKFEDITLTCVDCGEEFIFEAGEQRFFYARPRPLSEPKRCPECRAKRKAFIRSPDEGVRK